MTPASAPSPWQNRIVEWGTSSPDQLLANPRNYRRHPGRQRDALRGSLDELNIIAPVIVNKTTGHLVDGHARVEEYLSAGVLEVPVAYVELTEEQEGLALLVLDPISALAVNDHRALTELLDEVARDSDGGLTDLLADLRRQASSFQPELEPEFGGRVITDEDMARAAGNINVNTDGRETVRVLCPHCGETLYIPANG